MKKILVGVILAGTVLLSGCSHNSKVNWEAELQTRYINTVQTYEISTFNDYYFSDFDVEEKDDGVTILHITIEKSQLSGQVEYPQD